LNEGQQWRPAGSPKPVQGHDFPGADVPRAFPCGIHDLGRNTGFVSVGTDHDTSTLAVASIAGWREHEGRQLYPSAQQIHITANASGGTSAWRLLGCQPNGNDGQGCSRTGRRLQARRMAGTMGAR